jgi:hypothetical protein
MLKLKLREFLSLQDGSTDDTFDMLERCAGPPLWSSGQSFWLQIQRSRVIKIPQFVSHQIFLRGYQHRKTINPITAAFSSTISHRASPQISTVNGFGGPTS